MICTPFLELRFCLFVRVGNKCLIINKSIICRCYGDKQTARLEYHCGACGGGRGVAQWVNECTSPALIALVCVEFQILYPDWHRQQKINCALWHFNLYWGPGRKKAREREREELNVHIEVEPIHTTAIRVESTFQNNTKIARNEILFACCRAGGGLRGKVFIGKAETRRTSSKANRVCILICHCTLKMCLWG